MHRDVFGKWLSDYINFLGIKPLGSRPVGRVCQLPGRRCWIVLAGCLLTAPVAADVSLQHLPPGAGFSVEGDFGSVTLGNDISCVGDVNGDGYDDFVVGHRFRVGNILPSEVPLI